MVLPMIATQIATAMLIAAPSNAAADPAESFFRQATAAEDRGEYDEALSLASKSVAARPTPKALALRATMLFVFKHQEEAAIGDMDAAVALAPRDARLLG